MACPSINYQGPTEMFVYWDNLFGSFMFVPTVIGPSFAAPLAQGTVTSASGGSVRHQPVTLSLGGKIYNTYTNNAGKYVFLGAPGMPAPTAPAQLTVMGVTQTVMPAAAQAFNVSVP